MSNTITSLIPDAISAMEVVSRELVGLVPAVARNSTAEATAKGTTVRSPVAPQNSSYSITPSMTPLAAANMTYTNRTISLDTIKGYKFHFESEEQMGLKQGGGYMTMWQQNVAQGMRTLVNELAAALAALYYNASRAYGTAGTTPFGSDLKALAAARTILNVNCAPKTDRHFIMDHSAAYNLLQLTQLTNVNQSGTGQTLREGEYGMLFGFSTAVEDAIQTHTVGTSTGQDCTAIEPVGETTIAYDGGDGGTILVGDTIAPASDVSDPDGAASKYVVNTAVTAASGSIVINSPGLLDATAVAEELTLGSTNYVANLAFSRDALVLATRPPVGGDSAIDETILADPMSGLAFRLAEYRGYHIKNYEMSILYGVGLGNPEHMAIIMG